MQRRVWFALFLAALLLPRLIAIDPYTLLDEPRWMERAGDYWNQLLGGKWTELYSLGYPAIPNLMMTAPVVGTARALWDENRDTVEGWTIAHRKQVLAWSRMSVGILTAAIGIALFLQLRNMPLFKSDHVVAGAVTIVLFTEPWILGMSRTVMMDAPLSLFLLLSLAAACAARVQAFRRGFIILSGVAWGLAFLTKPPSLFFPPFILLPLLEWPFVLLPSLRRIVLWGASALATMFLLWPALWVHPVKHVYDLIYWSEDQVVNYEPHYWPGWHPPFVIVALSLPLFVGLIWYIWSRFREFLARSHQPGIFFADIALLSGVSFQALMQYIVADRSRWILPALVFLAVPGAVGLLRLLTTLRFSLRRAAVALAVGHAAYTVAWFPYLTLHMNPLLRTPAATWQFGMGEGYREVAQYLDALPERPFVATKAPGSLRPYLADPERVQLIRFPKSGDLEELPQEVTHIVIPWGLRNRTILPYDQSANRVFAWADARHPVHTVTLRGVPLFGIFSR